MAVDIKPTSVIVARLKLQEGGPAHAFFTATCAKAMDKYVPWNTGALAETVIKNGEPTSNVTANSITYAQNYAKVVYYGVRKGVPLHYQTDTHASAGPYWDQRMWSVNKDKIVRQVQRYVSSGGIK